MSIITLVVRFNVGQVVITEGAWKELTPDARVKGMIRHVSGDWGELDEHDRKKNDAALERGGRLFSQYFSNDGSKFWIITEHDRSKTTILLPSEY